MGTVNRRRRNITSTHAYNTTRLLVTHNDPPYHNINTCLQHNTAPRNTQRPAVP